MFEEVLTGDNFLVDEVGYFMREELLDKIEFNKEEYANITGLLDGLGEPVEEQIMSWLSEVKDFARRACALHLQVGLDVPQPLKFLEESVHLAHFQTHNLAQHAFFELLEHFITVHRSTFEQP
jgi:hypothetical protein